MFKDYLEILLENKVSFLNKTTLPNYDDMINNPSYFEKNKNTKFKIVNVTGTEYIRYVAKEFKTTRDKLLKTRAMEDVLKYKADMLKGDKFPILIIDIRDKDHLRQEGLHRAMAAEMIDPKMKIPVMLVKNVK